VRTLADPALFGAVLANDERAWRELVRRYEGPLREVVREATQAIHPLSEVQIDDVLGDFWLRLIEGDMRRLRAFKASRKSALLAFLTMHAAHVAYEHIRRIGGEPMMIPLDEVRDVADLPRRVPAPPPLRRETMLRVEDVAKRWDLNVKTVYGMIERGELTARRFGRILRIPRSVVEFYERASVAPEGSRTCR
jgi:excisionase family DNA binding protein